MENSSKEFEALMDKPNDIEILDEHIISEKGCYRFVRRWVRGWHPDLGQLTWGLAGKETVMEISVIRPTIVIEIKPD